MAASGYPDCVQIELETAGVRIAEVPISRSHRAIGGRRRDLQTIPAPANASTKTKNKTVQFTLPISDVLAVNRAYSTPRTIGELNPFLCLFLARAGLPS